MSNIRSLSRNAAWITFAELAGKLIAFISIILITRYLSKDSFGQYSFIMAFGLVFGVLANFGFGAYTTREIAKNKEKASEIIGNLLSLKIILSVVVFTLLFISAQFIDRSPHIMYGIYVVGFVTIFDALRSFVSSVFQAFEKMQYVTLVRIGERLLYFSLLLLALLFNAEIIQLLTALAISSFVFSVIGLYIIHTRFAPITPRFDISFLKIVLLGTFYFVINDVFIIIFFKIDSIMLTFLKGDVFNAEYTAAYNLIYSSAVVIPAVLTTVLYPVLTRFYNKEKSLFKENVPHILKYFLAISFPVVAFFLIFGETLLSVIYKGKYDSSLVVFQVLSTGVVFVFLNFILSTILNTIEKQKLVALASFIAMAINIGMNIVLIPAFGILGAGTATIITEMLFCAGLYYFVENELKLFSIDTFLKLLKVLGSLLFASVCGYLLIFNPFISFLVFLIVFGVFLYILGVVTEKDINYFKDALNLKRNHG